MFSQFSELMQNLYHANYCKYVYKSKDFTRDICLYTRINGQRIVNRSKQELKLNCDL